MTAVADALDYAHERDLLHRDVKPANILLAHPESGDQRILLADFGIARWVNDISGLTATNMTVGTVSYAAPEQLMGEQLDGRADQYALAATAFHLLTGVPPFQHSNPAVVISQHLSASPPAIGAQRPELSALDPVLAKALAKDPNDRFERCADFARALGHRLDAAPTGDVGTTFAPAAPPPKRSLLRAGVIVPAILAVLLVAAITVAVIEFRRADRPSDVPDGEVADGHHPTFTPLPPPPEPVHRTTTASPAPPPAAVIGANCSPVGQHRYDSRRVAPRTARCCKAPATTIWSLHPGRHPEPDGDHRPDRRTAAGRGGVAGSGVHAADRADPAGECREDDPAQQRLGRCREIRRHRARRGRRHRRSRSGCPRSPGTSKHAASSRSSPSSTPC